MHYYSYKYHEVMQLEFDTYQYLVKCMVKAKANDDLELLEVVSFPQMSNKNQRKRIINNLNKKAETQDQLEERAVTTDDLAFFGVKVGNIADHIKDDNGK